MKKKLLVFLLVAMLITLAGCMEADPMMDDLYTRNVYPSVTDTYDVGSARLRYDVGYFRLIYADNITGGVSEIDPIFTASDAFPITTAEIVGWNALVGSQWVDDVNGIHYSAGSIGVNTNSVATELVTIYSNDGTANNPVLLVFDNSASGITKGIKVNVIGAKTDHTDGIYITNATRSGTAGKHKYGLRIRNTGVWNGVGSVNYGLYIEEPTGGTSNVGAYIDGDVEITGDVDIGGDLDVTGTTTLNDQLTLVGDGKVWIELRPELDFDIIKKNAVPLSYERGIFSGFELPIWAADNQELFFDICVPDRWDAISTIHVQLDIFLIDAQDDGDDFRLQVDYEDYTPETDVVPNTSTPIEVETATGASAAFQSYHVHFDIPAGDMIGDDILAFRLRRVAVVGTEITGNVVLQHAGVVFLCDKLGNPTAE